jgi:tRNA (cmo5U34)-methyltransferase
MTEFDKTQWAKPEFTQEYRDSADVYIVERKRLLEILKSFYKNFIGNKPESNILDIGCGDGIVIYELLKIDHSIRGTLIDGSEDMLNKAKDRLKDFVNLHFIQGSFQEILNKNTTLQSYDFIVSSLAIHHLTMAEKTALFRTIYSHLNVNGYFLNIDVILAPSDALEQWYLLLWKQWIDERKSFLGVEDNNYDDIIGRYKDNTDNKPDTLDAQIKALQTIGFKDVDCFYKYGIFTMYGGKK